MILIFALFLDEQNLYTSILQRKTTSIRNSLEIVLLILSSLKKSFQRVSN